MAEEYVWDYMRDPYISPLHLVRWDLLAEAQAEILGRRGIPGLLVSVGGGGESRSARALEPAPARILVVDPSQAQIERQQWPVDTKHRLAIRAVAENLPVADGSVETLEMSGSLDHFDDLDSALDEARRVLVSGGIIAVSLGNARAWYKRIMARLGVERDDSHQHNVRLDPREVERRLIRAGFRDVECLTIAYLRLPLRLERITHRFSEGSRRQLIEVTDRLLRRVVGAAGGGMFVATAEKR